MNRHSAGRPISTAATSGAPDRGLGQKRARILDAAIRVFAEKGFYNARVSEIAEHARVADGTIYLYFKSKDDLLISLFEDRMDEVIDNARAAVLGEAAPADPIARLARLLETHLDLVARNPQLAEVLTVELRQSSKFLKQYKASKFGEFLKLIARPIEDGQQAGIIRPDLDAHLAARSLFGALDELVLAWVLGAPRRAAGSDPARARVELATAGTQLASLLIEGLRVRGDDRKEAGGAKSSPKQRGKASASKSSNVTKRRAS